jgi:hypothetical protein
VLGLSLLGLFVTWFQCKDPILPTKSFLKLPQYHRIGDGSNGVNGVHEVPQLKKPEPLQGWRMRMGVLQVTVLLALVASHVVLLQINGPSFLGFVLIAYWVVNSR